MFNSQYNLIQQTPENAVKLFDDFSQISEESEPIKSNKNLNKKVMGKECE